MTEDHKTKVIKLDPIRERKQVNESAADLFLGGWSESDKR